MFKGGGATVVVGSGSSCGVVVVGSGSSCGGVLS